MEYSLAEAVKIVGRFVRGAHGALVTVADGRLRYGAPTHGCEVALKGGDAWEGVVLDFASLAKAVHALPGAELSRTGTKKRSHAVLTDGAMEVTLHPKDGRGLLPWPDDDRCQWRAIPAAVQNLMGNVGWLMKRNAGVRPDLGGVRLTPTFTAAMDGACGVIVWAGLVNAPVTVTPDLFDAEIEKVGVGTRLVWTIGPGQTRYAVALNGSWPDDGLLELLSRLRGEQAQRTIVHVEPTQLADLCKRAALCRETRAVVFRLSIDADSGARLVGRGTIAFNGRVPGTSAAGAPQANAGLGVDPFVVGEIAKLFADEYVCMSMLGQLDPCAIWNAADPVTEAVMMPLYWEDRNGEGDADEG